MPKKRTTKQDDLEFEIQFYESLLKRSPNFVQAMIGLGELYTKKGDFEKGLQVDQKLAHLRPEDPYVLYNLACSFSLLDRIDESFKAIKAAVDNGYDDLDHLMKDRDLAALRADKRFKEFLASLRNN